jgi:hypothetical protein
MAQGPSAQTNNSNKGKRAQATYGKTGAKKPNNGGRGAKSSDKVSLSAYLQAPYLDAKTHAFKARTRFCLHAGGRNCTTRYGPSPVWPHQPGKPAAVDTGGVLMRCRRVLCGNVLFSWLSAQGRVGLLEGRTKCMRVMQHDRTLACLFLH